MNVKEFVKWAKSIHGGEYEYPGEYLGMKKPIDIRCKKHGIFTTTPATHIYSKSKCPKCSKENRRSGINDFIKVATEKHNGTYDYSKSVYVNNTTPIEIICKTHGSFFQTPKEHKRGKGCIKCNGGGHVKKTTEEFISEANSRYDSFYDYSECEYTGARNKIKIICPHHGEFYKTPDNHLRGSECPVCTRERKVLNDSITGKNTFVREATKIHGEKYDYSKVNYINCDTKVTIVCSEHGEFKQIPYSHLRGMGCKKCGSLSASRKRSYGLDDFITRARTKHGDAYDYSLSEYQSSRDKIKIVCSKHGVFYQNPSSHIRGAGCPACFSSGSKAELEILEFVKSFGLDAYKTRDIIPPMELDIYIPSLSMAIEYCGLYWHSEQNGKDRNYHLKKYNLCREAGIRLITIFEDEWNHKKDIVKSALTHFFGKSERGCYARKSIISEIDWKTAKSFLDKHHLMGAGHPGKHRIGAFDPDGNLLGVMVFGSPSDERGATDVIEMKRFVTNKKNNPGLGSKMFSWAIKNYGFSSVIAFVDQRWFTGVFKLYSGFNEVSMTAPAMYWTDFNNRYHRRIFTKKELLEMEQFKDSNLTKPEMMAALRYSRIWDCGKLKLRWDKTSP